MPKPTFSGKTKSVPMPMPAAAVQDADETLVQRPRYASTPKPTLWQRLWYGAAAERRLAAQQVPVADSLSEVKAGVLAEMQSMARTKGGVSGSPFANVMLPQQAKAATAPVAKPRRRWGWLWWPLALLAFGWLLLQLVTWRTLPVATAPVGKEDPALLPFPANRPSLADQPVTPAKPATVDLLAKPVVVLGRTALAEVVSTVAMSTAPVANSAGQMVFSATVANASTQPLRQVQFELKVDDQAGVPLLRRVLTVPAIPAKGEQTQRFVLDLLPTQPEHLVATVPLRALRAVLVPLQAEVAN